MQLYEGKKKAPPKEPNGPKCGFSPFFLGEVGPRLHSLQLWEKGQTLTLAAPLDIGSVSLSWVSMLTWSLIILISPYFWVDLVTSLKEPPFLLPSNFSKQRHLVKGES